MSLWFNYQSFQQKQQVQSWKEYSYNQFVSGVISGGKLLGYHTSWYDTKKASLAIGEAAMAIKQWSMYCNRTHHSTVPNIENVANYLSYIALVLADPSQGFKGDSVEGKEYVKNITNLLFEELVANGHFGEITNENENKLFKEMYMLIPKDILKGAEINFFSLP